VKDPVEKDIWRVLEAKMMHYNSTFHQLLINDSHGWQNISSRPGNCRINVCSMVPERLADATPDALCTDNQLLSRQVSESNRWTDTHGTDYGILCKANRASLHQWRRKRGGSRGWRPPMFVHVKIQINAHHAHQATTC